MLYETRDGKVVANGIEYSVSYHCNLRCSGCSHMSPYLGKRFPSLDSFASDLEALGKAFHARDIRLVGGEPLLNPEVAAFARVAKASGIADCVMLTTNGILLHRMGDEFWENVDFVSVTLYPGASPPEKVIESIRERAKESGTRLRLFPNPVFRTTVVTKPQPMDWVTGVIYRTCKNVHLYHCHMLHEGKLYKCAVPPFLPEYLAKVGSSGYDPSGDAFDIHAARDIARELKEFLFTPFRMEACRYCLGFVGKFQESHQLAGEEISDPAVQGISRETHLDRYKFAKETVRYCKRRFLEWATGKPRW
jgi:hypothetical protein